ncbi:hypothetical protein DFH08DRAFT_808226 [Mycena albidolilacea]|uniref:Uncharacterized protein n=1 Tax=Mycena albidolilacea TaxID=1033008 RepID=A0AAD7A2X9_9AGAR|nr:hypothetical protein DFH08DRAFT_808226 [Mycena albidolilacea]
MKDKIGQLSFQGDREPVAGSMQDTAHKTHAGEVAVARYKATEQRRTGVYTMQKSGCAKPGAQQGGQTRKEASAVEGRRGRREMIGLMRCHPIAQFGQAECASARTINGGRRERVGGQRAAALSEIIFELCYKEFDKKVIYYDGIYSPLSPRKRKKSISLVLTKLGLDGGNHNLFQHPVFALASLFFEMVVFWREVEMLLMDFNECCTPLGRAMSMTGGEDSDAGADTSAVERAFRATGVVSAPRESSEKSLSGLLTERARDAKRRDRGAEVARRDLAAEVARAGVRAVGLGSADGSLSDLIVGIGEAILECARRECATGRIRSVLDSIKVTGDEGGEAAAKKVVGMALIQPSGRRLGTALGRYKIKVERLRT